jgi:phosphoribosylanthranilate isomerase
MNRGAPPWLKICGVTCVEDALLAQEQGADAIGLNFVPWSKRRIDEATAQQIADAVRGLVELVAVVADEPPERLLELSASVGFDWLQLHGNESPSDVSRWPRAFKAVGIESAADVARAASFPGERLLLDAKSQGLGGSGIRFDWSLARGLAASRRLILAGGLDPDNVIEAIRSVRPWGLDVASGVERAGDARRKDPERVARFIAEARAGYDPP